MATIRQLATALFSLLFFLAAASSIHGQSNRSLASWRNTRNKQAVIDYVKTVSTPGHAWFVPPEYRIATFDMDGTLLVEKPVAMIEDFTKAYLEQVAESSPFLRNVQPYKAVFEKDLSYQENNIYQMLEAAYRGLSQEEYTKSVLNFVNTGKHPRFELPYFSLFYSPMLELILYLQDNGFRVFIVSGSSQGFVRSIVREKTGISNSNIIGTQAQLTYQSGGDKPLFMRDGNFRDLGVAGPGKPVAIEYQIGEKPILAAGNSIGDQQMFEYTSSNTYKSLVLCLEHDDDKREYAYDSGVTYRTDWLKISMKNDFAEFFK